MKETGSASRDCSPAPLRGLRGTLRGVVSLHRALILCAVLSLTINVATRYCQVTGAETQSPKAAKSHSPEAERQHLLNDGLHWSAPSAAFVLLEPTRVASTELPRVSPAVRSPSENCIYTRPPPFC
jgi:hypothetical protein